MDESWKDKEKIVALLEKFISPDCQVEHNKFLPVLGRPNREPRQFDVVVTTSLQANRKHIAVFEVQKRGSKPDINTFGGWIVKMREVGANQLICVSEAGFPQSIIDEVKDTYGQDVVTLMTLKEFDVLTNPQLVNMDFTFEPTNKHFEIVNIEPIHLEEEAQIHVDTIKEPFNLNKPIFTIKNSIIKINIRDLVRSIIEYQTRDNKYVEMQRKHKSHTIHAHITPETNVWVHVNNRKFKIQSWKFAIEIDISDLDFEQETKKYVYKSEIINEELVWVASHVIKLGSKTIQIDLIAKMENGKLKFGIRDKLLIDKSRNEN